MTKKNDEEDIVTRQPKTIRNYNPHAVLFHFFFKFPHENRQLGAVFM